MRQRLLGLSGSTFKVLRSKTGVDQCSRRVGLLRSAFDILRGGSGSRGGGSGTEIGAARYLLENNCIIKWEGIDESVTSPEDVPQSAEWAKELRIERFLAQDSGIGGSALAAALQDMKAVKEVRLMQCHDLSNDDLHSLSILNATLQRLEIVDCPRVSDHGIMYLLALKQLEYLKLKDLRFVQCVGDLKEMIQMAMPQCEVVWPIDLEL